MALTNSVKAISTTAVALNVGELQGQRLYVYNLGPNKILLGSSSVTSSNGVPLAALGSLTLTLDQGDILYAVCSAAETASVGVLSL
jgi:hypothetical protein